MEAIHEGVPPKHAGGGHKSVTFILVALNCFDYIWVIMKDIESTHLNTIIHRLFQSNKVANFFDCFVSANIFRFQYRFWIVGLNLNH